MRYSIEKESEVKSLAAQGRNLDYISSVSGVPKKVIRLWCPELRPHEDVIKRSVLQRFHSDLPEYEAEISSEVSKYAREDITDDEWESLGRTVSRVLLDEAVHVFKSTITDPPEFTDKNRLSEQGFLDFLKDFWSRDRSPFLAAHPEFSDGYVRNSAGAVRYYSRFRKKLLRDMTSADLEILHENLSESGLSEHRINFILRAGRTALKYAYQQGMTLSRAYDHRLQRPGKSQNAAISTQDALELFSDEWSNPTAMLANFLAFLCGLRQNETRALRGKDFGKKSVTIAHTFSRTGKLVGLSLPRTVPLTKIIVETVRKLSSRTDGYIFSKDGTTPMDARQWTLALKDECRKKGLDYERTDFSVWRKLFISRYDQPTTP